MKFSPVMLCLHIALCPFSCLLCKDKQSMQYPAYQEDLYRAQIIQTFSTNQSCIFHQLVTTQSKLPMRVHVMNLHGHQWNFMVRSIDFHDSCVSVMNLNSPYALKVPWQITNTEEKRPYNSTLNSIFPCDNIIGFLSCRVFMNTYKL